MLAPYPLAGRWQTLRERMAQHEPVAPTGVTRALYLDLAERIVRAHVSDQQPDGALRDPYRAGQDVFNTARYVGALGQLIAAGRCHDLIDSCLSAYENLLRRLDEVHHAPEFWVKEMMVAHAALKQHVPASRRAAWESVWQAHDGRQGYHAVVHGLRDNFNVFAAAGEFFKLAQGVGGAGELMEDLLAGQEDHFTAEGLYRDPADPFTYDLVVRQQFDLLRAHGYAGPNLPWLAEVCRRGALTALLYQSSTGQMPFGGRSNQFHFVEAHFACMCEAQARFYKDAGDPLLAGAFKRAGRRAVAMTVPWILGMEPYRQTKQAFAPALEHGLDSGGYYSVYGLLMASLCATAYHLADETIAEGVTPAELGGYVFPLWPAFHKVFATCGGYHLEIDLKADPEKDATGLGRLHRAGLWPETALSAPLSARPTYTYGFARPERALACGPAWLDAHGQEQRLAALAAEIEDVACHVREQRPERVVFDVTYHGEFGGCRRITESYDLSPDRLRYHFSLAPAPFSAWLLVPLLVTDGEVEAEVQVLPCGFAVTYRGGVYRVVSAGSASMLPVPPQANRNALYRTGRLESRSAVLTLTAGG